MSLIMTNFEKWIEALRSGKYEQNHDSRLALKLDNDVAKYCCLGVACELWHEDTGEGNYRFVPYVGPNTFRGAQEKLWSMSNYDWDCADSAYMPSQVSSWLFDGLTDEQKSRICGASREKGYQPINVVLVNEVMTSEGRFRAATDMNDMGVEFREIADIMEREVLNLGEEKQSE